MTKHLALSIAHGMLASLFAMGADVWAEWLLVVFFASFAVWHLARYLRPGDEGDGPRQF